MKKLFSTLLTLVFVLSFGSVAFAIGNDSPGYMDTESIDLGKEYKILNADTDNPMETFNFVIEKYMVTDSPYTLADMPMFDPATFTIDFAEGEATLAGDVNTANVMLPDYDFVGIFYYKLTETAGNTAGVMYEPQTLVLKITVIDDNGTLKRIPALRYMDGNEKPQNFNNKYSAGSLEVSKTVTGNLGDKEKYFEVKVKLNTPDGKVVNSTIGISGGSHASNPTTIAMDTETSFMLKHGETITFTNVPYGVTYTVVETDYTSEGYLAADYNFSDNDKKIDSEKDTVGVTNYKNMDVDTGISLDSIPYILILGLAVLGISGLLLKRRKNANF